MAITLKMTGNEFGFTILVELPDGSFIERFEEFSDQYPESSYIDPQEVTIDNADHADYFEIETLPAGVDGYVLFVLRIKGKFVSCALWGPDGFIDTFDGINAAIEFAKADYTDGMVIKHNTCD